MIKIEEEGIGRCCTGRIAWKRVPCSDVDASSKWMRVWLLKVIEIFVINVNSKKVDFRNIDRYLSEKY